MEFRARSKQVCLCNQGATMRKLAQKVSLLFSGFASAPVRSLSVAVLVGRSDQEGGVEEATGGLTHKPFPLNVLLLGSGNHKFGTDAIVLWRQSGHKTRFLFAPVQESHLGTVLLFGSSSTDQSRCFEIVWSAVVFHPV